MRVIKFKNNRIKRHKRIRSKVKGSSIRPRLFVFKSNKYTYAGIVDDIKGTTIVSCSDNKDTKETKTKRAFSVGELIGEKAKEKGIKKVVFDRSGYKYHGRVKALADGARKSGLIF